MQADTSHIRLLQSMPLFGGVDDSIMGYLLSRAREVSCPEGAYYFRESDPGNAMYVLESGRVAIVKCWQDEEYVLRELNCGDSFGEMALIDLFPRSASVLAKEDCEALEISSEMLFEVYERDPRQFTLIQMNVAREISRRLRVADERLFELRMSERALHLKYDSHIY
ncbi:MAG: Crp/Fnr family transcriptional regulator [Gammaproteobacteria bacterium]|jgi:CRP-like cAMP-binding protein|nr:Crp/Fnr family transcriptional regulator [Gammaproteobacteria bacterium]